MGFGVLSGSCKAASGVEGVFGEVSVWVAEWGDSSLVAGRGREVGFTDFDVGAPERFGPMVAEKMLQVAEAVERSELYGKCGHSWALEKLER